MNKIKNLILMISLIPMSCHAMGQFFAAVYESQIQTAQIQAEKEAEVAQKREVAGHLAKMNVAKTKSAELQTQYTDLKKIVDGVDLNGVKKNYLSKKIHWSSESSYEDYVSLSKSFYQYNIARASMYVYWPSFIKTGDELNSATKRVNELEAQQAK